MKRLLKLIKDLIKIAIPIAIAIFLYFIFQIYVSSTNQEYSLRIPEGGSAISISEQLEQRGIINSDKAMRIYLKLSSQDTNLIAGTFIIPQGSKIPEITQIITSSPQQERFVIQEGLTIKEIDEKFSQISSESFIQAANSPQWQQEYNFITPNNNQHPLEGYIYPDTYFIDPNSLGPSDVIKKALDNFQEKTKGLEFTYDDLILASIIEQEVRSTTDRKIVADIYKRRLEADWRLDADITVVYLTGNRQITYQDLQSDSPYNTRKQKGLPPGPVSNPSLDSLKAVLNPTPNDYWFYLTTLDTGEVIYAKSNQEHEQNKDKYL